MRILHREVQIYRDDNENIMMAHKEMLHSLNMLQKKSNKDSGAQHEASARQVTTSKSHSIRDGNVSDRNSRSRIKHHHSLYKSTRRAHAISGPGRKPSVFPFRRQRRRHEGDILQGEINNIKPPNFNAKHRKGDEVEAWMLGMKKYFQLHDYPSGVETRIATYQLQGKLAMWWEKRNQSKHLDDKRVSWRQLKGYFKDKYLSEHYYDKKMKDFFELKLGSMKMDEYHKRFFRIVEVC
jgi:hypothetical protein